MTDALSSQVITEPLGGSALSQAIQGHRLAADLQPWSPRTPDEWRHHADRVRASASAAWYDDIREALSPSGNAALRLDQVAASRGIVVTTGQQAALFGGPLYTLNKALTALGLADVLQDQLGLPVAPVFWAATDDADFLEASVTHVADANGLHELRLTAKPAAGTPMSLAPLDMDPQLLDLLRAACGSAAHAAYFDLARAAFTRERTVGAAYVRLLRDLLEPLGIAVLDSSHPAYTAAARPLLVTALERGERIAEAGAARAAALRAAGFEPQVLDDRGLSLVAVVERGLKRRVPLDGTAKVLTERRSHDPLAPNVLLRPIVERELLPTAAYVAGPAELAYFAQSSVVAEVLDRVAPVGVPRWSCTVLEPFTQKALRRLGISHHELRDRAAVERKLARQMLPPDVAEAWTALELRVQDAVARVARSVSESGLMPATVLEGLQGSLAHRLKRTERRLLAAVKRREDRVAHDLAVAADAVYPGGARQERMLNFVPMLARGGPDLLEDMRRHARAHALGLVGAERAEPAVSR